MLEFETHRSIRDVPRADWNALLGPDPEPYLRWEFLEALEATGCVRPEAGWAPLLLTLRQDRKLCAIAPAYVKGNSEGEFVFDHSWARFAYENLAVEYYPKLVVACPFTPATGRRVVFEAGADGAALTQAMAQGVRLVTQRLGLSSAHVLFPRTEEVQHWAAEQFAPRSGVQYHWSNHGYATFDDFLSRYNAKRRHQVKRERKELHNQGLELRVYTGSDISPEVLDASYEFYTSTVEKYYWGKQYLNRDFFIEVGHRLKDNILIVLAIESASKTPVAGSFNLLGEQRLFGRYWGTRRDYKYLHFNVCYYAGIAQCIERGLSVFEPGAGGEHKVARGFEPTLTHSAHYLVNPELESAVRSFLQRERAAVRDSIAADPGVFKAPNSGR